MALANPHAAADVDAVLAGVAVKLASPRKLPRPDRLRGRVAVLDIAFASQVAGRRHGFERTTLRFIEQLGPRLAIWVDHHDSAHHARFAADRRFLLATKAEHGACPEMIDAPLVRSVGAVETIVCHDDFDGIASAAKWLLSGREPYPGCDADARAVDTRIGEPSVQGRRFDRALRAAPKDKPLRLAVLELLVQGSGGEALWARVDAAAARFTALEAAAERLAAGYQRYGAELAVVDVTGAPQAFDRTALLLRGQRCALVALVIDGDTATFAAPFDSGVDLLERFGLSGGMPTLVSIHRPKLGPALSAFGVEGDEAERLLRPVSRAPR